MYCPIIITDQDFNENVQGESYGELLKLMKPSNEYLKNVTINK